MHFLTLYSYFVAYEVIKKSMTPVGSDPSKLDLGAIILAGGAAGVAMWSIAIPPDVRLTGGRSRSLSTARADLHALLRPVPSQTIKSRLQSAPSGTYSGFIDCASKTIKADGVRALWKGFGPAMTRAFPASACTCHFGPLAALRRPC